MEKNEIKLAPKMTDTPETDQAERESIAAYIEEYGPDAVFPCDGYDHARKLERERNGLHDLHNKNATRSAELLELCQTLRKERMINAERELTGVTEQRDRLLKHLNVLAYWRDISECDCHNPLPNGGCLRCDLDKIFNATNNQND